ncbi:MAG: polymer-forming cytoskeletal protein [Anaerolineae bacterium]|nr:polymer-forming cytoskeletal protein [Anaerolineae bacterium]
MRNAQKILPLFITVIIMLGVAAYIRDWLTNRTQPDSKQVIFTDEYTLSDSYGQSLAVVADTAVLGGDSHVNGDAALVGHEVAQVDGLVTGDLTVVGDALTLGATGRVLGDLSAMGSAVTLDGTVEGKVIVIGDTLVVHPGAKIAGSVVACVDAITDLRTGAPPIERCKDADALMVLFAPLQGLSEGFEISQLLASGGLTGGGLLFSLSASLLLTGLSALAVTIFPRRFSHVQEALLSTPGSMAALGSMALLLVVGLSTGVIVIVSALPPVGLILVPLSLLMGLVMTALCIVGWITLALLVGDFTLRHLTRTILPPVIDAAFGSVLLFTLWHVLAIIPFGGLFGLLLMGLLGVTGFGAALATRAGTRPLRRRHFVQG